MYPERGSSAPEQPIKKMAPRGRAPPRTHSAQGEVVAEKNQVGVAQAEQAIEEVRALDYDELKLTAAPNAAAGPRS